MIIADLAREGDLLSQARPAPISRKGPAQELILLTTEEREREREALELVLVGVTGALGIFPADSLWRPDMLDIRMILTAQIERRLEESDESS